MQSKLSSNFFWQRGMITIPRFLCVLAHLHIYKNAHYESVTLVGTEPNFEGLLLEIPS